MKSLWEITRELQDITIELIENGGELTDDLNEVLNINNSEFETKAENYLWLIKNLENEIELRKSEIKRLQGKNEGVLNTIATLKNKLLDAVKIRGKVKISDFNLSVGKSKSTIIEHLEDIPLEYISITLKDKVTEDVYIQLIKSFYSINSFNFTPDKTMIKKAIENGVDVDGAYIKESEHLVIK